MGSRADSPISTTRGECTREAAGRTTVSCSGATAEQRLVTTLQEDSTKQAHDQKEAECQEVALMLKELVEENSQIRVDLQVRTDRVYQL